MRLRFSEQLYWRFKSSGCDAVLLVNSSWRLKYGSPLQWFDPEDEGATKCWEVFTQWHNIKLHKTWIFGDISGSIIRFILKQYADVYWNLCSFKFLPLWMRLVSLTTRDMLCFVSKLVEEEENDNILYYLTSSNKTGHICAEKKYDKQYCKKQNPCYGIMFVILLIVEANNIHVCVLTPWNNTSSSFYTSFPPSAYMVQSYSFWTEFISP